MAAASGKEERKAEWPVWPALSLEHVAADEAKIKGKKGGSHRANILLRSLALDEPGASVFKCESVV